MRLIDADELLKQFRNKGIQITFDLPVEELFGEDIDIDDFTMLMQDAVKVYRKMAIDTIENMPTAYTIDKVVDELELHSFEIGTDTLPAHYVRLNDVIEIVKQGGVSDDVCEYKYNVARSKDIYFLTSCGHRHNGRLDNSLPYCGFCGKKIKVVE